MADSRAVYDNMTLDELTQHIVERSGITKGRTSVRSFPDSNRIIITDNEGKSVEIDVTPLPGGGSSP